MSSPDTMNEGVPRDHGAAMGNLFSDRFAGGHLKSATEVIRTEVGADPEVTRQALADYFALDRQHLQNHFDGRLEYARHVMAHQDTTSKAVVEYGLQTLKWAFLLNAGAIAAILAYIGAAAKAGSIAPYAPMIKALWPFVVGCVCVPIAGAAAFFNFSYAEGLLPTAQALNSFLDPTAQGWPIASAQRPNETLSEFYARFGWKIISTRRIAIGCGLLSATSFLLGAVLVMRAALP